MNELISVIIPIYNSEKYLTDCLESIIMQTYKNLQIILVDDGSNDSSSLICDKYAYKDKRIKVIHQDNKGLSAARNTGIENASGNYYLFIDSDDDILPTMIEELYDIIKEYNADIAVCNFQEYASDVKMNAQVNQVFIRRIWKVENIEKYYEINDYYVPTVVQWNKLFKKDIFNNLRFPLNRYHEDEFMIHHELYQAKSVIYTNRKLYRYYRHNDSITDKHMLVRIYDIICALIDRIGFYREHKQYELSMLTYNKLQAFVAKELNKYLDAKDCDAYILKINEMLSELEMLEDEKEVKYTFKRKINNLFRIIFGFFNREGYTR